MRINQSRTFIALLSAGALSLAAGCTSDSDSDAPAASTSGAGGAASTSTTTGTDSTTSTSGGGSDAAATTSTSGGGSDAATTSTSGGGSDAAATTTTTTSTSGGGSDATATTTTTSSGSAGGSDATTTSTTTTSSGSAGGSDATTTSTTTTTTSSGSAGGSDPTTTSTTSSGSAGGSDPTTTSTSTTTTSTGSGGAPQTCPTGAKTTQNIPTAITGNLTLTADKDWLLTGVTAVRAGATLTIEPCTTVKGVSGSPGGVLVVHPGGKIMAEGEKERPIIFTSAQATPVPGDWGGVVILGDAPINVQDANGNSIQAAIEGLASDGVYGGNDANDNSGVLKYVRIEYAGYMIAAGNELNGLTMGGVGRGTTIDYVEVRQALDDCFEFFGGNVNAKHLICSYNQDDGFDFDFGFSGKLQFLLLQQNPGFSDETNGFESDNNASGTELTPFTNPTVYNATLCGRQTDVAKQQYGFLLRRATHGSYRNVAAVGFEAGLDVRNANTSVDIKSSVVWASTGVAVSGNNAAPVTDIAYPETMSTDPDKDDDGGLDEVAFWNLSSRKNGHYDPAISCFGATPTFTPAAALTTDAATPPNDGFFDTSARFIGGIKDSTDNWATGAWVSFDAN